MHQERVNKVLDLMAQKKFNTNDYIRSVGHILFNRYMDSTG